MSITYPGQSAMSNSLSVLELTYRTLACFSRSYWWVMSKPSMARRRVTSEWPSEILAQPFGRELLRRLVLRVIHQRLVADVLERFGNAAVLVVPAVVPVGIARQP